MNLSIQNIFGTKIIKGAAFSIALVSLLSSCDPLGLEPSDKVDEDHFWQNTELARSYVNNLYLNSTTTGSNDYFQSEQWSDNAIGNYEKDWDVYRQESFYKRNYDNISGVTGVTLPWSGAYSKIRAINIAIQRLPGVPRLEESKLNQMLGESYFFRAWQYFDMEHYWGGVPIVDKPLTVFDETMIPRASRQELFDFILADLDKSIEYFEQSGLTPTLGLVNIDAVYTFKSRVALYAGCAAEASEKKTFSSLDGDKTLVEFSKTSQSYYEIAFQAASKVLGKRQLAADYAQLFNSSLGNTMDEAIFPVMFKDSKRSGFNPVSRHAAFGPYYFDQSKELDIRGSAFPTQDLVDLFLQKDEQDGKWKKWYETSQVAASLNGTVDADGNFSGEGLDYSVMFENRDKRFYAICSYDGSEFAGNEIHTWVDNTVGPDGVTSNQQFSAFQTGYRYTEKMQAPTGKSSCGTITGYYPRKYMQEVANEDHTINTTQQTVSYFNIRYAEVLLNYAEAAIKTNKQNLALDPINQIRNRAGLSNFDAAAEGHDIWEELKIQRRLEFAFEVPGQRYFDILRWSAAEGKTTVDELNGNPRQLLIIRKGIESKEQGEYGYPVEEGGEGYFTPIIKTQEADYDYYKKVFDDAKYYFFPFNETMIKSYKGLIQNPGWAS
ncbi:MAG: RagB/SusD family nutrient uptake outer membrane protein [Bacteroidales bacterium]|nr:RagB/SusD family nutrient uptake outer membrane protein [Bacteroidales bacterium]